MALSKTFQMYEQKQIPVAYVSEHTRQYERRHLAEQQAGYLDTCIEKKE